MNAAAEVILQLLDVLWETDYAQNAGHHHQADKNHPISDLEFHGSNSFNTP
jgi:hypothetical protein